MATERKFHLTIKGFDTEVTFARLTGTDALNQPFHFTVDFVAKTPDLKALDLLGKGLTIEVTGAQSRFFNGLIAEFWMTEIRADYTHYRVTVVPALWFAALRADNRIFQKKSVVDIVEEVCGAFADLTIQKSLQKTYAPRDYCVQYGETDLTFVQRLLEHEGIAYHFDYEDGRHTMVLTDDNSALKAPPGAEYVSFNAELGMTFLKGDFISSWVPRSAVRTGKYAHTDYDFVKPSTDLMWKTAHPAGHPGDDKEVYHYPGNYLETARGDKLAALRLEELQAPQVEIEATGTATQLWSGRSFTLEDFPRQEENAKHLVLRAEYALWDERFRPVEGGEAQGYSVKLTLAPERIAFRPARLTPRPQMKGPQTAVVVGPAGAEIFTDQYARVRVQFHWDRLGKKNENSTCFIRVSQTWAGAGWGFIQIPRIGQEVIVDFLEGDPDQPIITGRVYNGEQMPPYKLPANATQSGWKSNSSPGGGGWNELRFEDKAGSEEVYFQAQKDHNELIKNNESRRIGNDFAENVGHDAQQSIGHDRTESVSNDKTVSVGNNRSVAIGVNDTETVGSNRSLSVGANETISVGSNSSETIGINHSQTVGVAQEITVGATRAVTVGATETRTVGATQSNTIGASRSVSVGAAQSHDVGADDTWTVGANQSVTVAGAQTLAVAKDQSAEIGGMRALKVAKDDGSDIAGAMGIKVGKKFLLDVADEIAIKVGSAAITMKKDGTITIEGKDITINGSGKINLKASSDVTIKGSKINNN